MQGIKRGLFRAEDLVKMEQKALKSLRGVLDQWIIDIDDKGRTPEGPEVLKMVEDDKKKPKGKGKNKKA